MRQHIPPFAVGPLDHCLDTANFAAFAERNRHRALIVREVDAFEREHRFRTAPVLGPHFRCPAPQRHCGKIEVDHAAVAVAAVDSFW